jgi:hypothetical protein
MEHWNKLEFRPRQGGFLFQKRVLFLEHLWNSIGTAAEGDTPTGLKTS